MLKIMLHIVGGQKKKSEYLSLEIPYYSERKRTCMESYETIRVDVWYWTDLFLFTNKRVLLMSNLRSEGHETHPFFFLLWKCTQAPMRKHPKTSKVTRRQQHRHMTRVKVVRCRLVGVVHPLSSATQHRAKRITKDKQFPAE